MRAVGYFREAPPAGETLAQQNKAFLDFCAREGYAVARTFADASSANGVAPAFAELIDFLRTASEPMTVVVPAVSAFGADLRAAVRRYFQLEGLGIHVETLSGNGDGADDLLALWSAQDPTNSLSDRVRAAMRKKAVKGEVLGRPPYGYKVGSRRRLELIPEEAVVVRYIFRLYLQEGMGIRLIARRLNEEALKTRRGANWSMVSIRDILRNRAYLGTYSRFGVRVPGTHTALVSEDDFRTVQDRLNARRTSYAPRVTSQFLLSGLAYCGYCGNKLIGVSRKQTWKRRDGESRSNSYRYYQCESRTNQSVCAYHTQRAEQLESQVRDAVALAASENNGATRKSENVAADRARALARLRVRLRAVDKRFESYFDDTAKGRLAKDKMRELALVAAKDRLALEDAIAAAEHRAANGVLEDHDLCDLKSMLDAWDVVDFSVRYTGLRDAIERISVTDDDIAVTLRS